MGTPKTLPEAIKNAGAPTDTYKHVRDFLAQRFTVEMCKAKSEEDARKLKEIFNELVKEKDAA